MINRREAINDHCIRASKSGSLRTTYCSYYISFRNHILLRHTTFICRFIVRKYVNLDQEDCLVIDRQVRDLLGIAGPPGKDEQPLRSLEDNQITDGLIEVV
jgi:hypothetical protein